MGSGMIGPQAMIPVRRRGTNMVSYRPADEVASRDDLEPMLISPETIPVRVTLSGPDHFEQDPIPNALVIINGSQYSVPAQSQPDLQIYLTLILGFLVHGDVARYSPTQWQMLEECGCELSLQQWLRWKSCEWLFERRDEYFLLPEID